MRVLKFNLEVVDAQEVEIPKGSNILSVQCQRNRICIWALCPESPIEKREFAVVGTGNPMPECEAEYIGTAQQFDGQLVWHVFELFRNESITDMVRRVVW